MFPFDCALQVTAPLRGFAKIRIQYFQTTLFYRRKTVIIISACTTHQHRVNNRKYPSKPKENKTIWRLGKASHILMDDNSSDPQCML